VGRLRLTWGTVAARNCMACKRSGVQIPSAPLQLNGLLAGLLLHAVELPRAAFRQQHGASGCLNNEPAAAGDRQLSIEAVRTTSARCCGRSASTRILRQLQSLGACTSPPDYPYELLIRPSTDPDGARPVHGSSSPAGRAAVRSPQSGRRSGSPPHRRLRSPERGHAVPVRRTWM
jgi:hypothetical protein